MTTGAVSVVNTGNTGKPCAIFNGTDAGLRSTADDVFSGLSQVSISAWINPKTFNHKPFVSARDGVNGMEILTNLGGELFVWLGNGSAGVSLTTTDLNINPRTWYHVVGTYDGATLKAYKNGVISAQTESQTGKIGQTTGGLGLGVDNGGTVYFYGGLANVKIFNKALTQEEITKLAASDNSVKDGLIHNWKLDEDFNDSVGDVDLTNTNTSLGIIDDAITTAIEAQRVTANDKFLIYKGMEGQVGTVAIEE